MAQMLKYALDPFTKLLNVRFKKKVPLCGKTKPASYLNKSFYNSECAALISTTQINLTAANSHTEHYLICLNSTVTVRCTDILISSMMCSLGLSL